MKRLLVLSSLAALFLLPASCANNSSAASTPSTTAGTSSDNGEGSLAYTVDGARTVVKRPASSIYINEVSHNAAKGTVKIRVTIFPAGDLLDFSAADKGTTEVVHYRPSFSEPKTAATFMWHAQNYYGDHVSVTISTVDAAHVAGTFSGTFADDGGKPLTMTDGSFDLPMKAKK